MEYSPEHLEADQSASSFAPPHLGFEPRQNAWGPESVADPAELAPLSAINYRRGGLAPWQVRRILNHIEDNLETTTRVADLAAVTRLSVSRFAHAFRASFDASPAALIRRQRVDRARQMLLTSRLSLAEIALACGFADQAHMSRLFRRHMDLPPARWRERMLEGQQ
jgi:transcriptional regulator GlxA family with amidase domain